MSDAYLPSRSLVTRLIGDSTDLFRRLKNLLPPWFGDDDSPILDAVLQGPASALAYSYSLLAYVRLQTRIATASDGFLDLASADLFGDKLPRSAGEADDAFRARIKAALFPAKGTRPALVLALTSLTGVVPIIVEPWNPMDTGGWNNASAFALNTSGCWGSRATPSQCFVTVHTGTSGATNAQVYAAIEGVRPAGKIVWTRIVTP